DMADLFIRERTPDGTIDYGHFDIRANSIRLNGLACTMDTDLDKLGSLTYHDELYESKLMELAGH
ncbi:MAG: hypothetical protein IKD62_01235, partial [Oscillospiraceae bacterium]|nr:hypothetical protein [Oscillospiraceae bacterium]